MLTWTPIAHVTVGICTYRRPSLSQTLESVAGQRQLEGVELSVLVVDNDESGYARNIVESFSSMHSMTVLYEIEARKNIATARNRCLQSASTDWLAFIDDDEIAEPTWLAHLVEVAVEHRAHAIFGQVVPVYAANSPSWIRRGDPFARLKPARGSRLETGSTANVLCHLRSINALGLQFDAAFGLSGGEDSALFLELSRRGALLVSCPEAVVSEAIPLDRMSSAYLRRRGLKAGRTYAALYMGDKNVVIRGANAGFFLFKAIAFYVAFIAARIIGYKHAINYYQRSFLNMGKVFFALTLPAGGNLY
jgi:succinoglycan biosynthesis protein ExoM